MVIFIRICFKCLNILKASSIEHVKNCGNYFNPTNSISYSVRLVFSYRVVSFVKRIELSIRSLVLIFSGLSNFAGSSAKENGYVIPL